MAAATRYDKYDPVSGGFRGCLAAAWPASDKGKLYGVSIDSAGKIAKGGASTAIIGVVVVQEAKAAGDMVDVMTSGELVDFVFLNDGTTAVTAGTLYYVDNVTGAPTATSTSNKRLGIPVYDGATFKGRLPVRLTQ